MRSGDVRRGVASSEASPWLTENRLKWASLGAGHPVGGCGSDGREMQWRPEVREDEKGMDSRDV